MFLYIWFAIEVIVWLVKVAIENWPFVLFGLGVLLVMGNDPRRRG